MIKTPNSFKPQCLFNISVQRTKGRGVDFSWIRIWSSGDACAGLWTYSRMLIFRHSESLGILLVIANAIHLNQVSLIWTAGNYPIHLEGTLSLSFSINHSVRLHQLHCVLVSAAVEWWMGVPQVHSPAVWLGAAGSSGNKWTGRVLVIWDMLSPNRSSPLHRQLSHLAASGVLGLSEEQAFQELSPGLFCCASPIVSYLQPSLHRTLKGPCHETLFIKTTGGRSF